MNDTKNRSRIDNLFFICSTISRVNSFMTWILTREIMLHKKYLHCCIIIGVHGSVNSIRIIRPLYCRNEFR